MLAVDPRGGGELEDDRIPLAQTRVPYNLQDVIDKGTGALDRLDSGLLGQALSTVADTLRASGPELLPALQGVDRISQVVSRRSDQIEQLLVASHDVTDQLSNSSGDLVELMEQTNLVVSELLRRREAIHRLLVDVAELSTAVHGIVADMKADIGPTLDNAGPCPRGAPRPGQGHSHRAAGARRRVALPRQRDRQRPLGRAARSRPARRRLVPDRGPGRGWLPMKRSLGFLLSAVLVCLTAASGCGFVGGGSRTITAVLPDSAGLFTGNDVGVLGVPVGKVTGIEPEGDHVLVTLEITDDDVHIPADAGAAVVARSVATDRYVELTPVHTSGPEMEDGARIPLGRTVTPVDFDQVLASIKKFGDGLVRNPQARNGIRDLVSIAARTLDGKGEQFNRTLRSLSSAVSTVHGQRDNIFGTMKSLDRLTSALAADQGTVRAFVANVADAADLLASERRSLRRALVTLSAAVDEVAQFTKDNRDAIRRNVEDATAVVRNLVEARRDLEETVEVLPLAADNLTRTRGPTGNVRVRANVFEAFPVNDQLDQVCAQLGTVCDGLTFPPNLEQLLGGIFGEAP